VLYVSARADLNISFPETDTAEAWMDMAWYLKLRMWIAAAFEMQRDRKAKVKAANCPSMYHIKRQLDRS
jgi:hypothetical protein